MTDVVPAARRISAPFAPSPALRLLQDAAALLGQRAGAAASASLLGVIAEDYPRSLERRPAQLLRAAGASADQLDELLTAAGFAHFADLRRHAAREHGRPLAAPQLRFTYRGDGEGRDRAGLENTLRREQENLAETLRTLQSSGELELSARAILGSRRRWVFGDLKSRGYAQLFASDLTGALSRVSLVEPTAAAVLVAASDALPGDSLTVFCFRRYSRLTVRLARQFAELGATVIAVTDSEDSPVCAHATHTLRVVTRSDSPTHSPTAVTAIGHALATLTAAGAKGAARRIQQKRALAVAMDWYEQDSDERQEAEA